MVLSECENLLSECGNSGRVYENLLSECGNSSCDYGDRQMRSCDCGSVHRECEIRLLLRYH